MRKTEPPFDLLMNGFTSSYPFVNLFYENKQKEKKIFNLILSLPGYTYCLDQVHIYLLDDQGNQMNEHTLLENLLAILIQIRHPTCHGNANR